MLWSTSHPPGTHPHSHISPTCDYTRWLKAAINPFGVYLMIPTWECFPASLPNLPCYFNNLPWVCYSLLCVCWRSCGTLGEACWHVVTASSETLQCVLKQVVWLWFPKKSGPKKATESSNWPCTLICCLETQGWQTGRLTTTGNQTAPFRCPLKGPVRAHKGGGTQKNCHQAFFLKRNWQNEVRLWNPASHQPHSFTVTSLSL